MNMFKFNSERESSGDGLALTSTDLGVTAGGFLGFWAFSALPTAFAGLSWDVCTTNKDGVKTCRRRIPRSSRIAIAVCCFAVLLLLFALVVCIILKRRASKIAEQEYNVEASQMEGPPTIVATEYNSTSGPSGVYSVGKSATGNKDVHFDSQAPHMTGPTMPAPSYHLDQRPPTYTAPVIQTTFSDQPYPFAYNSQNPPHTSFVSNGFPRPLLAGDRLKDRLKERPSSASGLNVPPPASR